MSSDGNTVVIGTAAATASTTKPQQQDSSLSAACQRCMSNLLSILNSSESKPMSLFKAMNVDISSYEKFKSGVVVHVPQSMIDDSNPTQGQSYGFGGEPSSSSNDTSDESNVRNCINDGKMAGRLRRRTDQIIQNNNPQTLQHASSLPVATSALIKPAIQLQISCKTCGNDGPEGGARAFVKGPNPLSIVLCSNRLSTRAEIDEVLVHELIHVYDVHHRNWDLTNCYTLAKSEVRAAREAECADSSMSFTKRYCAKEKARVATKNMFPDVGLQCVAAVFEEAMKDKAPFPDDGKSNGATSMQGRSFQSTFPSDLRASRTS